MKGLTDGEVFRRDDTYFFVFSTDRLQPTCQPAKATQWRTFGPAKSHRKQPVPVSSNSGTSVKPETIGDYGKERQAADVLSFLSNGSPSKEAFDQRYAEDYWSSVDNNSVEQETDDQFDWAPAPGKNKSFVRSPYEGPGAFPCDICGKVYKWRRTLQNHKKLECGKEPQFKCPFCPLRSKRKELSRFWQNQFLKEARRGSSTPNGAASLPQLPPPPPPPMTPPAVPGAPVRSPRPRSGSPRSPRSADWDKVLWLPELMRRRSLDMRDVKDGPKDSAKDLSLPKADEDTVAAVALDMSASILIQHADNTLKEDEDDQEQMLDATPGEGPGAFPCPSCGKVYRWKRTLRNHLRSECGKEPQFQCPYCHLRSKRKSNIYAHIRVVHHKPKLDQV